MRKGKFDIEPKEMNTEAIDALKKYSWPGNVRELRNLISRLIIMVPFGAIGPEHIPEFFNRSGKARGFLGSALMKKTLSDTKWEFERAYIQTKQREFIRNISQTAASSKVVSTRRSRLMTWRTSVSEDQPGLSSFIEEFVMRPTSRKAFLRPFLVLCAMLFLVWNTHAGTGPSIVGRWEHKGPQMQIIADFNHDGSIYQVTRSALGTETLRGRYRLDGAILFIQMEDYPTAQQIHCRFESPDAMTLTYETGQVLRAHRVQTAMAESHGTEHSRLQAGNQKASPSNPALYSADRKGSAENREKGSGPHKPIRLLLHRVWEPNEKAFTVLVPPGWQTAGGIFNVNPLKTNGPGNTLSPKCDFTIKDSPKAKVMLRWMPSWNYADLTFSPTGFSLFQPGQYYQGMLVRIMPDARTFLMETLQNERPRATDIRVVAQDPMREVSEAFSQKAEAVNQSLRSMGIAPLRFESLAMLVEYTEEGILFREGLMTTIADNRAGAFQWSNENTVLFRAPASEFPQWKLVLDTIQSSRQVNPQWLMAVTRASGERAKKALETQQYIQRVANDIVEHRRQIHTEIRHENWLFISGQEEYKNPFTGEVERGTSEYLYRWVNNQGAVLHTDENGFDPNRYEEYNTREWKRSEIWDRRPTR